MISVIVSTKNRPQSLRCCIKSLLENREREFEIIIIDQSNDYSSKKVVEEFDSKKIRYVNARSHGKGAGVVEGISKSRGSVISIIDDDCIASKNWLVTIKTYLKNNKGIDGVFGKILPYKPRKHKGLICPATFTKKTKNVVSTSKCIHYRELGLGHNMSIRKSVCDRVGGPQEWLGAGNRFVGGSEESEWIFRMLTMGYTLAYEPSIQIHHNRWHTLKDEQQLQVRYTTSDISFHTFHLLQGHFAIYDLLKVRAKDRFLEPLAVFLSMAVRMKFRTMWRQRYEMRALVIEGGNAICGVGIGCFQFLVYANNASKILLKLKTKVV